MSNITTPAEALSPLSQALAADGYELGVELIDTHAVRLDIKATESACEECLVPKQLFAAMAGKRLQDASGTEWTVEVVYPAEGHGSSH
jgi:hypothetical protein